MQHFGSTVQGVHLLQGSVASFLQGWPQQMEGRYRRWLIWKSLNRWISHLENQHVLGSQLHAVCLPAIVEFNMCCRSLNGIDKLNGLETEPWGGQMLEWGYQTVQWFGNFYLWSLTILIYTQYLLPTHVCQNIRWSTLSQLSTREALKSKTFLRGWWLNFWSSYQCSVLHTPNRQKCPVTKYQNIHSCKFFSKWSLDPALQGRLPGWRHTIFVIKAIKASGVSGN